MNHLLRLLQWIALISPLVCVYPYRLITSIEDPIRDTPAIFEPYVTGEVGYYGDPSIPDQVVVNEGGPMTADTPRIFFQQSLKVDCPGMIGPMSDGEYFCHGQEYGYCDRRMGICICNKQYTGIDCMECKPSYFRIGDICYPKKQCPKDCSGGGTCDYLTGLCKCFDHRKGEDCSQKYCSFDNKCLSCTNKSCLRCIEGYYVDPISQKCVTCKSYDPRCLVCDNFECIQCADLLLNSVYRSGARDVDAQLPFDELKREFTPPFPYGSQNPHVFDEAEVYEVVRTGRPYLNETSKSCAQGHHRDSAWTCKPYPISHMVCGHAGLFSFASPEYGVYESSEFITISVKRSGGGASSVSINYILQYTSATSSDISPTAFYTSSQQLVFLEGVVEVTFLLTIHDNHVKNSAKQVTVFLLEPEPLNLESSITYPTLGNQKTTSIKIWDDDATKIVAEQSYIVPHDYASKSQNPYNSIVAGMPFEYTVQGITGNGLAKTRGGDIIWIEAVLDNIGELDLESSYAINVIDNKNGSYKCIWTPTVAGSFNVSTYILYSGGLKGEYYKDVWFHHYSDEQTRFETHDHPYPPVITRIDRQVNFTWNDGAAFTGAADYFAVRWSGMLKPRTYGATLSPAMTDLTFYIEANDNSRLWIAGVLVIDCWDLFSNESCMNATITLDSSRFHSIVLEYRELQYDAYVRLYWSSTNFAKEIIPSTHLFHKQHVHGSPSPPIFVDPKLVASAYESLLVGNLSVIAGQQLNLKLFLNDGFGNTINQSVHTNNLVTAQLEIQSDFSLGGIGPKLLIVDHLWNAVELWSLLSVSPTLSGEYALKIAINNEDMYGSPFLVTVTPSVVNPTQSHLSGEGLLLNQVSGLPVNIILETRDVFGNRIYSGGLATQFEVRAVHATKPNAIEIGEVTDQKNGTYILSYTPRYVGEYNVVVKQNNAMIHNSPYKISCVPNVAFGPTTIAIGSGLSLSQTNIQASFIITARDLHSNAIQRGGNTFEVVVESMDSSELNLHRVFGSCVDSKNGQYTCVYIPERVGLNKLHVGLVIGTGQQPIEGSPFSVVVTAGPALASRCKALGMALVSTEAGQLSKFIISIHDAFGNIKVNAGSESVDVMFEDLSTNGLHVNALISTLYIGDGLYEVSYRIIVKGMYLIHIFVNTQEVFDSPFHLRVTPGNASYISSSLDLIYPRPSLYPHVAYYAGSVIIARITARDIYGNTLESGGNIFVTEPSTTLRDYRLIDESNGSYSVSFLTHRADYINLRPFLYIPGGLNGSYYSNSNRHQKPYLERHQETIEYNFGTQAPFGSSPMTTFSIDWNGYIYPQYSEIYIVEINAIGDWRIFIDDNFVSASSQKFLNSEVEVEFVARQMHKIKLEYDKRNSTLNGMITMYWSSLSQKKEVIPAARLYSRWQIENNVPPLDILPDTATPYEFTPEFPGSTVSVVYPLTIKATAGITFRFRVIARDKFGNARRTGGDRIHVVFPGLPSDVQIYPDIKDKGDGTYDISLFPKMSGSFSMIIAATDTIVTDTHNGIGLYEYLEFLRPFNIQQSPITFVVQPNVPISRASTVSGPGAYDAIAGEEASFHIQLRDELSNLHRKIPDTTSVYLQLRLLQDNDENNHTNTIQAKISLIPASRSQERNSDFIKVVYRVTVAGLYGIYLKVNDGEYTNIAMPITVKSNYPSAVTSLVSPLLSGDTKILTHSTQSYYVQLKDQFNNNRDTGSDNILVELHGPTIVYGTFIDFSNGTYLAKFEVKLPGRYDIRTSVGESKHGLKGYYYAIQISQDQQVLMSLDSQILFDWKVNRTTPHYPVIQWRGYLKPLFTEIYTIHLVVDGTGMVRINDNIVIDLINIAHENGEHRNSSSLKKQGTVRLVAGHLHAITIDYHRPRYHERPGSIALKWESDRQQLEIIPSEAFIPSVEEILPRRIVDAVQ